MKKPGEFVVQWNESCDASFSVAPYPDAACLVEQKVVFVHFIPSNKAQ